MSCSPKDLQKFSAEAKDEIGESLINLQESVQRVKCILQETYPDLRLPPKIDDIVERCLRVRKFDDSRAATQVHLFFKYLLECRTLHKDMLFQPNDLKEYFFDSLGFAVLKNRDSKGRMVLLVRMERMPSSTFNLEKTMTSCIMMMDEMSKCCVETQRLGVVIIGDFYGYEFGHARQFTLARIRTGVKMIQGSLPVRFKGMYIVRCPLLFKYTYELMKPFLREKIKNRIQIHSHDLTEFHKEVSPDILPEYLGGKIPNNDYADLEFNRRLFANDEYYKELFRYGYFSSGNQE